MYVKNLKCTNFRGYIDSEFQFLPGVNLIIGNNGSGKTSLLSALSISIGYLFRSTSYGFPMPDMDDNSIRKVYTRKGDSTYSVKYEFPQCIDCRICVEDSHININIHRDSIADNVDLGDWSKVYGFFNEINKKDERFPLFCYQSFDRDWKYERTGDKTRITVEIGATLRQDGYKDCLLGKGIEEVIQNWCFKMAIMEYERKQVIHEFWLFKDTIKKFMQFMLECDDDIEVSYSTESQGMEVTFGNHRESIYDLSTGYRVILSLIMELAYRSTLLNPEMDNFTDLNGIVMIDEIDAHLHPRWQWKILDALQVVFPKVQFIIATHSPIVISSAKDVNIIKLIDLEHHENLRSAYGYTANEVLELRQGSKSRPRVIVDLMSKLEKLIDDNDFLAAKALMEEVKRDYGKDSAIFEEMNRFLKVNTWLAEAD